MLRVLAPAKINLSLEILGRRPDGYHDLISVMHAVALADTLEVRRAVGLTMTCSDPALSTEDNLVLRAASLVRKRYGVAAGCSIHLEKRIPVAAGLGGGSSDAAAALLAVTRLWEIAPAPDELLGLALELGSDVPFFLVGGTALVKGRGERVTPLPAPWPRPLVLAKPPFGISTSSVFGVLRQDRWTDGHATRQVAEEIRSRREVSVGVNGLQETAFELHPAARTCLEAVSELASGAALLSGSGPTVFGLFALSSEAEKARAALERQGFWTATTCSYTETSGIDECA